VAAGTAQAKTDLFVKVAAMAGPSQGSLAHCQGSLAHFVMHGAPGSRGEKKPKLLSLGLNPPKEEGGGDTGRSTEGLAGGAASLPWGFAFALWRAVGAVVQ